MKIIMLKRNSSLSGHGPQHHMEDIVRWMSYVGHRPLDTVRWTALYISMPGQDDLGERPACSGWSLAHACSGQLLY